MKAEDKSKSTFIGQFVYSINDVVYEWVDAKNFEDARSKLHKKSDWDNDRYDLNVFCSESYQCSQLQALKQRLDDYKAHPIVKRRNGEEFKLHGFISIEEAKRIITNLEANGH